MATGFFGLLPYLVVAVIVYGLFHLGGHYADRAIVYVSERRRQHRNLGRVLGRRAQGGLMLVGLLVALVIAIPSFQPGQLVQLLGISGVAIGFAFRDILQNFLAGILILLTEPFRIGDQIAVNGYEGTVEEIETRATSIRTYDGRRVVIPNATVFSQSVTVDTAYPTTQVLFHDQTEETDGERARQREGWPSGPSGAPASRDLVGALRTRRGQDREDRS